MVCTTKAFILKCQRRKQGRNLTENGFDSHQVIQRRLRLIAIMGLGKSSIKLRGAEVGMEAVMLGCITSIGGFLFGK